MANMIRLFKVLIVATAACCSMTLAAEQDAAAKVSTNGGVVYWVPSDSPVKFIGGGDKKIAKFSGEFSASGKYTIKYRGGTAADSSVCHQPWNISFEPDKNIALSLPHSASGPVSLLYFENSSDVLRLVADERKIGLLKSGQVWSLFGRARLSLDNFTARVECGTDSFFVRFVRFEETK